MAHSYNSLLDKILPDGSVDQQVDTWIEAEGAITDFVKVWETDVGEGLPLLVNNATVFANWGASSGITGTQPSLDGLTTSIGQALGAAAVSSIFAQLNILVGRAADTDVHALQTNGTAIAWDTGCENGYDAYGICGNGYFWDGTDTYAITNPGSWNQNYYSQMEYILGGTDPITTGALLFTGGHECFLSCGTNGGCTPTVDPTDPSYVY